MTYVKNVAAGNELYSEYSKPAEKTEKKAPEQVKDGKKKMALALTGLGIAAAAGLGLVVAVKTGKINLSPTVKRLKDIKFDKGVAKLAKNGKNFTGEITDTLKNGKKILLKYDNGAIQYSKITEKTGQEKLLTFVKDEAGKVFKKSETIFRPDGKSVVSYRFKNGKTRAIEVFTKKNERIITLFDEKTGKKCRRIIQKFNFNPKGAPVGTTPITHEFLDNNGKIATVVKQKSYGGEVSSIIKYAKNGKSVKAVHPGQFNPYCNSVKDKITGHIYDLNKSCGSAFGGSAGYNQKANDIREFIGNIADEDIWTDEIKEYILKKVKV